MAKLPQLWAAQDGSSQLTNDGANVQRVELDGTLRLEQDGTVRILQETVVTPKSPTAWVAL